MNKQKYLILLWMIVILFTLIACGKFSGESSEESQSSDAMEESGDSESLELLPGETAIPTETVEQPTKIVQDTGEETSSEGNDSSQKGSESTDNIATSGNSGDVWGESNSPAQSACDHPYFPIREGATWEYEDTEGPDGTWTITKVTGDLQSAIALMEVVTEGITLTYQWDCDAGEGVASFDYASLSADTSGVNAVMTIEESSGAFLPPAEDLALGHVWDLTMKTVMSFTMDVDGFDSGLSGMTVMTQTHKVVGEDALTVNDVNVPGVQVEVDINSMVTMDLGEIVAPPQTVEMKELLWLGFGIGLVRQETLSEFGKVDLILKSFYIP